MTEILVPLNKLRFGQEAPTPINARVIGREDDIPALAANLHAEGQIENVLAKDFGDGFFYIANGNRRLAAWRMIYGDDSDVMVRCTVDNVTAEIAFEHSLTTAVTAKPLHPVDQYEAFATMEANGRTGEEIARNYGMTEKQVGQVLALGRLSPKIRDAWRAGEIKTEAAQAFTLAADHKAQDKVFAKLAKNDRVSAHYVREELGAKEQDNGPHVNFVGIAEYEARGGKVTRDLFKERHLVSDAVLLKTMVGEKLDAECARLVATGWNWACVKDSMPAASRSWDRTYPQKMEAHFTPEEAARVAALQKELDDIDNSEEDRDWDAEERIEEELGRIRAAAEPRCFSDRQKAALGCIVDLDDDGRLEIVYGVKRPAAVSKAAAQAAAPTAGEPAPVKPKPAPKPLASVASADVSHALTHRLSIQLTKAADTALIQDKDLAISVLLAAFASDGYLDGLKVGVSGLGADKLDLLGAKKFADNLELARELAPADRVGLLVLVAGAALDFQSHSNGDFLKGNAATICNAIEPKAMNAALRGAFDAADYFESVSKAVCIAAIKEALGADAARQQEKNSKSDVAAFAVANVQPTGWLPPQLRPKGYDGRPRPAQKENAAKAAKPADRAKAKPKAKKAAAKKSPAKKRKAA